MIAGRLQTQSHPWFFRLFGVLGIIWASLLVCALILALQWLAVGLLLFFAVALIAMVKPLYGCGVAILIAFAFEPWQADPFMLAGWYLQSDVSSWSPIRYINFSPLELLVLFTAIGVLGHAVIDHRWPDFGELRRPLFVFLGLIALSTVYGISRHGDFRTALWETRSIYIGGLLALLLGSAVRERAWLDRLATLLVLATVLLSLDIIWRRFVLLSGVSYLDLSFAHETPFLMNFVIILLLARVIWPAKGRSWLLVLFLPLILFAEGLTQRRAGWIGLDVGLLVLGLAAFRVRRKFFFYFIVPLGVVYLAYLGAFWNASPGSTIAQPARAVRSLFSPDARDASSDVYRLVETQDTRLNIHAQPLTGLGFGQPFVWYIPPTAVLTFDFAQYITHNSFLWLWMNMGPVGFIAFLVLAGTGIVRGTQLTKSATRDPTGPVLLACVAGLVMGIVYTYVDISFPNPRFEIFLGLMLGCISAWSACRSAESATVQRPEGEQALSVAGG